MTIKDPDTLNLTKEQVLEKFKKIESNIMTTNEGIASKAKFKIVFGFVNWLVSHYDIEILNRVFLGMIKEFDEWRFENALEGDDPILKGLKNVGKKE